MKVKKLWINKANLKTNSSNNKMLTSHLIHSLLASYEEPFILVSLGYLGSASGAFGAIILILSGGRIFTAIPAVRDLIRYAAR